MITIHQLSDDGTLMISVLVDDMEQHLMLPPLYAPTLCVALQPYCNALDTIVTDRRQQPLPVK